jgi:hypothetical protein
MRLRRLLQDIGRDNAELLTEVKEALSDGADQLEFAIVENLRAVNAEDTGDLIESVAKVRRSSGLQWRVGFFRSGAIRKWRKAGWRAHFIEFGTKYPNQPAHRPVLRAREREIPHIARRASQAVNRALRRIAQRNRSRSTGNG